MDRDLDLEVALGDAVGREHAPHDMFLAVYAAGGGKRNMANFVRPPRGEFAPGDIHVHVTARGSSCIQRLFICRYASYQGTWVAKPLALSSAAHVKLIPEWFKARFWDSRQEKKHPWFLFAALGRDPVTGRHAVAVTHPFPIHQFYPTGPKRTDPNSGSFEALHDHAPAVRIAVDQLLFPDSAALAPGAGPLRRALIPASPVTPLTPSSATGGRGFGSDDDDDDDADGDGDDADHGDFALAAAAAAAAAQLDPPQIGSGIGDLHMMHGAALSLLALRSTPYF